MCDFNLTNEAKKRGFTEARVISPTPFLEWEAHHEALKDEGHPTSSSMTAYPHEVLKDAKAIIVLMTAYSPYDHELWPEDCLQIHPHYIASNRQYQRTTELIKLIQSMGYRAQMANRLPERHAALRAGYGRCGRMGLLIHPEHGSYICFHTIITDMPLAITHHDDGSILSCQGCNLCVAACPNGAINGDGQIHREHCLRYYAPIERPIPYAMRKTFGMRYIGCDACQEACIHNRHLKRIAPPDELIKATELNTLLGYDTPEGREQLKALQQLIGKNNARPQRMAAAAALHAGNSGDHCYAPHLIHMLSDHPWATARSYAAWALGQLGGYDDNLISHKSSEQDDDVLEAITFSLSV